MSDDLTTPPTDDGTVGGEPTRIAAVTSLSSARSRLRSTEQSTEESVEDAAAVTTPAVLPLTPRNDEASATRPIVALHPRSAPGSEHPSRRSEAGRETWFGAGDDAAPHESSTDEGVVSFGAEETDEAGIDGGDEVDPIDVERIADTLVKRLARKGLSVVEARSSLLLEGVGEVETEEIIERFLRFGYLDDLALATALATTLRERKKLGRSAIIGELRSRKLDDQAITEAMEVEEEDEGDELALALEVATKRAASLRSYDRETAERRLTAFLMRRGYASSIVREAVRTALGAPGRPGAPKGGGVRFR